MLYVERSDFREDPPKKYFRLAPGREVRLRYAYFITCVDVVKDPETVTSRRSDARTTPRHAAATHPTAARSVGPSTGSLRTTPSRRRFRVYDHLFTKENPEDVAEGEGLTDYLNPSSLTVLSGCRVELSVAGRAGRQQVPIRATGVLLRRSGFVG